MAWWQVEISKDTINTDMFHCSRLMFSSLLEWLIVPIVHSLDCNLHIVNICLSKCWWNPSQNHIVILHSERTEQSCGTRVTQIEYVFSLACFVGWLFIWLVRCFAGGTVTLWISARNSTNGPAQKSRRGSWRLVIYFASVVYAIHE